MYIKLTRLDNTPIWLNASFIVTIEPRRNGGATVVPIGDGLDYDVRETPEVVLQMLAEAPVAPVVPVPAPKGLAPKPSWALEQAAPEQAAEKKPEAAKKPEAVVAETPSEEPEATPATGSARKTTRKTTTAKKPRATRKTAAKKAAAEEPPPAVAEATPTEQVAAELPPVEPPPAEPKAAEPVVTPFLEMSEDEVIRLRKMMPRTIKKLQNTLLTQFHVADVNQTIEALAGNGVLKVEQNHILWQA